MMAWWRKILSGVDRLVLWGLDVGQYVLFWPLVYALAWAAALWPLRYHSRIDVWAKNKLTEPERAAQLDTLIAAFGVMVVILVLYWGYCIFARAEWDPPRWRRSFNRFFAFSLAGPFIVSLAASRVEVLRPLHAMFFIALATAAFLPTASVLWEAVRDWREHRRTEPPAWLAPVATIAVLALLFVGYAVWFSRLTINNHHALQTRIFDLAIYDNIFYQSSHGNFLGCSLSRGGSHITGHFDPILALLSPIYLIEPRAETILILQAVWCAAGVFPAYLLGRHHVGTKWAGVVFATAWTLYPALHGANAYDFHSLTLLASPLLLLLYFLTTARVKSFFVLLPLILLIREDVSLLVFFLGLSALLTRDPRLTRLGWITIGIAGAYFLVTKTVIMAGAQVSVPATTVEQVDPLGGKTGFAWYYKDLIPKDGGLKDMVVALLTNPTFAIDLAFRELKVVFLLQLLLPLAFLPLFGKPWRFAMAFGLVYLLLATRGAVYSIAFQYSVVLFPVLFALAPIGLRRIEESTLPARLGMPNAQVVFVALIAVLCASVLMSWKFGGILENRAFKGGWMVPPRTLSEAQTQRYEELLDFLELLPPDASVSVIGRMGPHVSNRAEAYRYKHRRKSEYFIFDNRDMKGATLRDFNRRLKNGEYELVKKQRKFELYRAVDPPKRRKLEAEPKGDGENTDAPTSAPPKARPAPAGVASPPKGD